MLRMVPLALALLELLLSAPASLAARLQARADSSGLGVRCCCRATEFAKGTLSPLGDCKWKEYRPLFFDPSTKKCCRHRRGECAGRITRTNYVEADESMCDPDLQVPEHVASWTYVGARCVNDAMVPPECTAVFTYKGNPYAGCTEVDSSSSWCSHDAEYAGRWSRCGPCKDESAPAGNNVPATVRLLEGAARCWRPSPHNKAAYTDPGVHAEMQAQLREELTTLLEAPVKDSATGELQLYPETLSNPLQMFGSLKGRMPYHYVVGLTNEASWRSHCLNFDYGAARDAPDPAGCGFFRASFGPLRALSECATAYADGDPHRQWWLHVASASGQAEPDLAEMAAELRGSLDSEAKDSEEAEAMVGEAIAAFQACQSNRKCTQMDTYERVTEMLKAVDIQNWDGLEVAEVRSLLRRELLKTSTVPQSDTLPPALAESTVDGLISECFKVPDAAAEPPDEALLVKEVLQCLPLMWDRAEVPGDPKAPPWPRTWPSTVTNTFKKTHPLCGRLALAGLARPFSRAKYPPGTRLLSYTAYEAVDDAYCFYPKYAQCKNFEMCWMRVMTRHIDKIDERCLVVPGSSGPEASAEETCCCRSVHFADGVPDGTAGDCTEKDKAGNAGRRGVRFFDPGSAKCCKLVAGLGCGRHRGYVPEGLQRCKTRAE